MCGHYYIIYDRRRWKILKRADVCLAVFTTSLFRLPLYCFFVRLEIMLVIYRYLGT